MILHINTKDQKRVEVSLRLAQGHGSKKSGKIVAKLVEEREYGSQVLLPMIVQLQFHSRCGNRVWKMLKGIEVETGPGSFTGIRVGVSVANALGYSLGIPVNGKILETDLIY